jgi:hypothetical protein
VVEVACELAEAEEESIQLCNRRGDPTYHNIWAEVAEVVACELAEAEESIQLCNRRADPTHHNIWVEAAEGVAWLLAAEGGV